MMSRDKFKERWLGWREALHGGTSKSIYNQIAYMLLDYLTWKVISEDRGMIADEAPDTVINGMTHHFIDRSYVDSQAMQIRKLADGASFVGAMSVYSLQSILKHMKDCAQHITRENICYAEGIPLATDEIREKKRLLEQEMIQKRVNVYRVPRELDALPIEDRHRSIDLLCGVTRETRNPEDTLRLGVLDKIENDLKVAVEKVKNYVDKHVAHAATPESIKAANLPLSPDLTFGDIDAARDGICRAFIELANILEGITEYQLVPSMQANHFEAIDKPLVRTQHIEVLQKRWEEWEAEINALGKKS